MMVDMFGNVIVETEKPRPKRPTIKSECLYPWNYRPSVPNGPRCRTCQHVAVLDYHNRRYYKCRLVGIAHSTATDIRSTWVCDRHVFDPEWESDEKVIHHAD
jgi:hypothetical protein